MAVLRRIGILVFLTSTLCPNVIAAEEKPSSIVLESPDYSKEALLRILTEEEDVQVEVYEDKVEVRWANWIFRFLPIVLPLTINDRTYGSAQINAPVSGLSLLGVDYPLAGPAGDELQPPGLSRAERAFRRRMIGVVNAANRRDNH